MYIYICIHTYIIINVCLYIISVSVYVHKVINAAEFAAATNLLSYAARDASLINVAISFTLQKQQQTDYCTILYDADTRRLPNTCYAFRFSSEQWAKESVYSTEFNSGAQTKYE